jgi:hypothetical protein
MIEQFGEFELRIDEFLVDRQKVNVRWTQIGRHVGVIDNIAQQAEN